MVDVTDVKTIDYNNNTNLNDVASNKGAIVAAKEIRIGTLPWNGYKSKISDVRNKSARVAAKKISNKYKKICSKRKDVMFVKQVPVHPRDRLKRKIKLEPYDGLAKKKMSDVTFVKQVPLHPQKKLERLWKIDNKLSFMRDVADIK